MVYIFDIEVYINFFSVIFKDVKTKEIKTFVIFNERNDLIELYNFINDKKKWFVGYNSHYFDNQILNLIYKKYHTFSNLSTIEICEEIKRVTNNIINYDNTDYKYKLPFRGLDLMRVGNLDQKPLKLVAVNLKWHKIQDLPIDPDDYIQEDQLDLLLKYNLNDVEITEALYHKIYPNIKLRKELSHKYKLNLMDESDSSIANRLLENIFSESLNIPIKELKEKQTVRHKIPFSDIVFDNINFKTDQLKRFLKHLKTQSFVEGASTFSERLIFGEVAYQLGIGGLHSDDKPGLFEETPLDKIIDADVGSYYPSAIINHKLYPEHLGDGFIEKYSEIRDARLEAKHSGDSTAANGLKIVLNSTYGKTNSKTHWLRDVKVTLQVTINCQLYLLMLIESLVLNKFKIISANTDGIVTIVPRSREQEYKNICSIWETETNFELEYTEYKKYCRRDVNNYITIKPDGKVKLKGEFETDTPLQKGFNAPIVSLALFEYYKNGTPVEETIRQHKDIYDFCIAKKSDKKFSNEYHYLKDLKDPKCDILQKTNRFYVSTSGGKLYKRNTENNKIIDYVVGRKVTIFNDYNQKDDYEIDYSYYINRAVKIRDLIENPQLTLF